MKFDELVEVAAGMPCFTTGFLAGGQNANQVRLQLSRWVKDGRVVRLRKGVYVLAAPYRKVRVELFCVANSLKRPSYVSTQSALAWYGLIPEYVPAVTSVTTGRPETIQTAFGRHEYRHIKRSFFRGYEQVDLPDGQRAFVATAEKALLDLVYLTPGGDSPEYIRQLRLQNLDRVNALLLRDWAARLKSRKLMRAGEAIIDVMNEGEGVEL
jgi:predicted transcriptional regulator of viral defense system